MLIYSKEKLSSNLKKLLAVQNLTLAEIAKELEIPLTTFHRIVNGQTLRPKTWIIKKLATFFDLTQEELIGEEDIEWGKVDGWLDSIIKINREVSLYSWTLNKHGELQEIENYEKIIITNSAPNYLFALKIKDTSMEPLFPLNSIVLCDPTINGDHDSYVILNLHNSNELVLRKLLCDVDIRYIKPLNEEFGVNCTRKLTSKDKILAVVVYVQQCIRQERQ